MSQTFKYCTKCGHQGETKAIYHGNLIIEASIWVIFFVFCSSINNFYLMTAPLIYSIYRQYSKKYICTKCSSSNLVEIDSVIAKENTITK